MKHAKEFPLRLWLVRRKHRAGYDEHEGFLVRAHHQAEARRLATHAATGEEAWFDVFGEEELTECIELRMEGPVGVLLSSFRAG